MTISIVYFDPIELEFFGSLLAMELESSLVMAYRSAYEMELGSSLVMALGFSWLVVLELQIVRDLHDLQMLIAF